MKNVSRRTVLLTASAFVAAPRIAQAADTVRFGVLHPNLTTVIHAIAKKIGTYEKHGLNVIETKFKSGQTVEGVEQLWRGRLDFYMGGAPEVPRLNSRLIEGGRPAPLAVVSGANPGHTSLVLSAKLQPKVIDLNTIVTNLHRLLQRIIGEHIEIRTAPEAASACVKADPGQIEQVIVNLGVNARDAMPRGGELRIATTNVAIGATAQPAVSLPAGTYVSLSVSDTGEGIPDDVLGHIFEPFYTTKAMGQGTGLGLATVHGIIKQSGGDIVVRTSSGRGTTFTIYLPATDAPLPLDESVVLADARTAAPGAVLLVEDDDAVREFAREVLKSRGWRVIEAPGPAEALAICTEGDDVFDVVVTDVVMPGLSGGELADRLEQLRPGVPVLFVSGYADVDVIGRGQLRAGRQLLSKPFTGAELAYRVQELFAAARPGPFRRRH